MAEMLLINPRRRRKAGRRANPVRHHAKGRPSVRRRRRNPIPAGLARYMAGRVNPRRRARRRNPIGAVKRHVRHHRRHRNPIGGGMGGMVGMFKAALIGGAGSVAMDFLMTQINPMLPASLQPSNATVTANDAIRAVLTAFLGKALARHTRGLSVQAAEGALTVQAAIILGNLVPTGAAPAVGFYSPAGIIQGTSRVGPIRQGVNAYMRPGVTPLLNAYTQPGRGSPLLSGMTATRMREGVKAQYR